jgi:ribosomal protein L12E/L44/L45/RPP1/RPP2
MAGDRSQLHKGEGNMKTAEKLNQILEKACVLEKAIKEIIREIEDYDLERLLKKIDAECMDVRHNLTIAKRLAESLNHGKGKKKP